MSCTVDFWIDSILSGYITKFVVDYSKSYSVAEREFFKGQISKYLKELRMWIKMALYDKDILKMENDS